MPGAEIGVYFASHYSIVGIAEIVIRLPAKRCAEPPFVVKRQAGSDSGDAGALEGVGGQREFPFPCGCRNRNSPILFPDRNFRIPGRRQYPVAAGMSTSSGRSKQTSLFCAYRFHPAERSWWGKYIPPGLQCRDGGYKHLVRIYYWTETV